MRRALALALTVLAATGSAARAVDQDAIDKAVERGVAYLRGAAPNGYDAAHPAGATALAGLTLLECGVAPDDKTVQAAAAAVREASITQNQTYALALGILFLDRLGDPDDVPVIESMTVRLLAGQNAGGGWTYTCPSIPDSEVRRLTTHLRQQTELIGRREPPKERVQDKDKNDAPKRRTFKDLPREVREQLVLINRMAGLQPTGMAGDNSNTQFATVALWVARRHGLPVDRALGRINLRYRVSQNADGGWAYVPTTDPRGALGMNASTATMTCAGLLGLTAAQGVVADEAKDKGKPGPDLGKDRPLKAALMLLSTAIGNPAGGRPADGAAREVPNVGGKTYYFLWSLERVAVALDLDTIGGKDWYGWGSEVVVANQAANGSWQGEYAPTVDTCFALLFLRRANLTTDLTADLKGKLRDPGAITLKAGGVGGDALQGALKSGLESRDSSVHRITGPPAAEDTEGARMARELAQAAAGRRDELLEKYRDGKGVAYTEALAGAIPQLAGEARRQARDALADRLTRMKPDTLLRYFRDADAEIRRAAALAAAQRSAKTLIPDLIPLLDDAEPSVARAAHAALKDLTGEQLGPTASEWKAWWDKQDRK